MSARKLAHVRSGVGQAGDARCACANSILGIQIAQSGDVRGLRRQHFHDRALGAGGGGHGEAPGWFIGSVAVWLWFTVLFANFAEALAEGRSKAQAAALRGAKTRGRGQKAARTALRRTPWSTFPAGDLRTGDVVLVEAGHMIPGDGEVIEGWPRSMKAPLPASPPLSFARRAVICRASLGVQRSCLTGSSCVSRSIQEKLFSIG